jgi:hypothetical protein
MTAADSTAPPTGAEPAHHVVVVTLGSCDPPEDHPGEPHFEDCYERSVECPGLTAVCDSWQLCQEPDCKARDTEDWPDETEDTFHGVEHRYVSFDGNGWAVATGECFYQTSDSTCDAISELELTEPGRYPVEVEVDDVYPVFQIAEVPR